MPSSNRLEMASLYWACQTIGAIFTPFNWRASGSEMAYVINDAEAKLVVYEERSAASAMAAVVKAGFPEDRVIQLDGGVGVDFGVVANGKPYDGLKPSAENGICLMLYTSGTTGRPKGVPRSHAAERVAALNCISQLHYRYGEIALGVMPLFHTMGIRSLLMSAFLNGFFVCMPACNTEAALGLVQRERISSLFLVPTMFHDIVHHEGLSKLISHRSAILPC